MVKNLEWFIPKRKIECFHITNSSFPVATVYFGDFDYELDFARDYYGIDYIILTSSNIANKGLYDWIPGKSLINIFRNDDLSIEFYLKREEDYIILFKVS